MKLNYKEKAFTPASSEQYAILNPDKQNGQNEQQPVVNNNHQLSKNDLQTDEKGDINKHLVKQQHHQIIRHSNTAASNVKPSRIDPSKLLDSSNDQKKVSTPNEPKTAENDIAHQFKDYQNGVVELEKQSKGLSKHATNRENQSVQRINRGSPIVLLGSNCQNQDDYQYSSHQVQGQVLSHNRSQSQWSPVIVANNLLYRPQQYSKFVKPQSRENIRNNQPKPQAIEKLIEKLNEKKSGKRQSKSSSISTTPNNFFYYESDQHNDQSLLHVQSSSKLQMPSPLSKQENQSQQQNIDIQHNRSPPLIRIENPVLIYDHEDHIEIIQEPEIQPDQAPLVEQEKFNKLAHYLSTGDIVSREKFALASKHNPNESHIIAIGTPNQEIDDYILDHKLDRPQRQQETNHFIFRTGKNTPVTNGFLIHNCQLRKQKDTEKSSNVSKVIEQFSQQSFPTTTNYEDVQIKLQSRLRRKGTADLAKNNTVSQRSQSTDFPSLADYPGRFMVMPNKGRRVNISLDKKNQLQALIIQSKQVTLSKKLRRKYLKQLYDQDDSQKNNSEYVLIKRPKKKKSSSIKIMAKDFETQTDPDDCTPQRKKVENEHFNNKLELPNHASSVCISNLDQKKPMTQSSIQRTSSVQQLNLLPFNQEEALRTHFGKFKVPNAFRVSSKDFNGWMQIQIKKDKEEKIKELTEASPVIYNGINELMPKQKDMIAQRIKEARIAQQQTTHTVNNKATTMSLVQKIIAHDKKLLNNETTVRPASTQQNLRPQLHKGGGDLALLRPRTNQADSRSGNIPENLTPHQIAENNFNERQGTLNQSYQQPAVQAIISSQPQQQLHHSNTTHIPNMHHHFKVNEQQNNIPSIYDQQKLQQRFDRLMNFSVSSNFLQAEQRMEKLHRRIKSIGQQHMLNGGHGSGTSGHGILHNSSSIQQLEKPSTKFSKEVVSQQISNIHFILKGQTKRVSFNEEIKVDTH